MITLLNTLLYIKKYYISILEQGTCELNTVFLNDLSGYNQSLYFRCALVDLSDPSIPVMPLRWHIRHIAHTTQNLSKQIHIDYYLLNIQVLYLL